MRFDDPLGDGEPEAGAALEVAAAGLPEAVEQLRQIVGTDPAPRIGDGHHDTTVREFRGDGDSAPTLRELEGVADEV